MSIAQKSNLKSPILHKIRQIARITNPAEGYQSAEDLNAEISSLILQGYRLVNTHFLGERKDQTNAVNYFGILYIFQLETTELERMKSDINKRELEKEA